MADSEKIEKHSSKKSFGSAFWRFHFVFWSVTFVFMFIAGLSQMKTLEVSFVRNLSYGLFGFFSTLLLIPLFDQSRFQTIQKTLFLTIFISLAIGAFFSVLVNLIHLSYLGVLLWDRPWPRWFSGSYNFALVTLLWCSFYLAFKQGLQFVKGDEEEKAAQAISLTSSLSQFPEFMALERNKKIILVPVENIFLIKAAGDYVELITDEGEFLKREALSNMLKVLDPNIFQRVHRSYIVNLRAIRELEPKGKGDYTVILKSGEKIASSRSYMKDFKEKFPGLF